MIQKIIAKLKNKNIAILGMGREGIATYKFIRKYLPNFPLTIIDVLDKSHDSVFINDNNVNFVFGNTYLNNLEAYDLVIKTPGISLKDIDTSNISVTSQIELVLEVAKDKVIGVTGTKGKSTTTNLIYNALKANGKNAVVAGNIGIPIFDTLEGITEDAYFVIEMSSHQLEFLHVSPHIGVVLNLFEDHLDHAGSVKHYYEIKMHMFSNQSEDDYMIYCQDNKSLNDLIKTYNFKGKKYTIDMNSKEASIYLVNNQVVFEGKTVFSSDLKLKLLGRHNLENVLVAYVVCNILHLDDEKTIQSFQEFEPLAYRLECIGNVEGVNYFVDTLATIPEATIGAIKSIPNVNTLILGGMDRGISYDGFADALKQSDVEHFICMPTTGHKIASELPQDKVYLVETLEEACSLAKKITKKDAACVLSPAASSYEHFKNYAEKGDKFKEYILNR